MLAVYLLILLLFQPVCGYPQALSHTAGETEVEEVLYEGRPHYLIRTRVADYYYDIRGGGFSRIIDAEGKDWIGFRMQPWGTYPASAASSYRGLPNLVFQGEDDGAGHPGHDRCTSRAESNLIISESLNGRWLWSWEFHDTFARLALIRTDPDRSYWFLYEGTPGGSFSPHECYFGTSEGGPHMGTYDYFKGDMLRGCFRWIYAGNKHESGTLFMIQVPEDEAGDMISFLGNTESGLDSPDGMTVFGFGRGPDADPLLRGNQCFIIGFYPEQIVDKEAHIRLGKFIQVNFLEKYYTPCN